MDPERNCKVSYDAVANWFEKEFGIAKSDTMSVIASEIDKNKDGMISFKEFEKYVSKTMKKQ